MAKPAGAACNLACTYCFYREKEQSGTSTVGRMSPAAVEVYVRDYLASQPGDDVQFAWQGGEPTLAGLAFFQAAVALQRRYGNGRRITNALQTNGTLLDDRWGEFLAREGFLVGVSVDGPKPMHDAYRIDRGERPTWSKVMRGLRVLRKHRVQFNTLTVLHDRNVGQPREVYAFLKAEGSGFMQFIPLVERRSTPGEAARGLIHGQPRGPGEPRVPPDRVAAEVAPECASPERIGDFFNRVFDAWVRRDVGRVFVQLFDVTLSAWVHGTTGLCVFDETCERALALEAGGDVYACDHYVYPEYRIGNLLATSLADLGHSVAAERFGALKAQLPAVCLECEFRFACHGDCPKHRFVAAGSGEPGVSYLCGAYRRYFAHVKPAMDRMTALVRAGRPAADVMG